MALDPLAATSSLDRQSEIEVQKALDDAASASGSTIVSIAHRLQTCRKSSKIYVLVEGKVVESGNWDDLMGREEGFFKKMWLRQRSSADHLET